MRPAYVANTIRFLIDQGAITFYQNQADLPKAFQPERMLTEGYAPQPRSVQDFVARKVWLLGLKAGGGQRETRVWIADPLDAAYLGCTEAELRVAANVLDAQDKIVLQEDGEFAQVGRVLLASEGTFGPVKDKSQQTLQTIFDVYTPQGLIGEGGSGRVLRVTDEAGAPHALKYLKPQLMTTHKTKRFRNELAFCFRNTHRNIITVEDWGLAEIEDVQVPFYVMPVFPKTLRSVMKENKKPEELIPLFIQVLDGIEEAHKKGIWHRDLKPENILIDETNQQVAITDFGVAHFSETVQTEIETRPHERLANFRYAAPEQRSNGTVDHRADIYALGLILYEMLTAELLQGTSHLRIALIHPNLAALDQLIEWMSCQMPSDRPFSVGEVRDALKGALDEAF
jgi:serine/threonine protein kinase